MEYKIAICDDDIEIQEYICSLVKEWAKKEKVLVTLDQFQSAEEFLFHYEDNKSYGMLLLDIEMKEMNGVQLAKQIRSEDQEVQIIFISGYMEYITDGYDVDALHYLLKPVNKDKLYEILSKAKERRNKREDSIILDSNYGVVRIPYHEIRYIEVRLNYVTIHAGDEYSIKKTLSTLEKELDQRFVRTGRSFLVNLNHIRRITKVEVILEDESMIPLSRGYYEKVNQAFIAYL